MTARARARRSRSDYPKGVLAVYDNGGKTADRYTVCYTPETINGEVWYGFRAMSENPTHPQGVCMFEYTRTRPWATWGGSGYGKVIAFDALPNECRRIANLDLQGEEL